MAQQCSILGAAGSLMTESIGAMAVSGLQTSIADHHIFDLEQRSRSFSSIRRVIVWASLSTDRGWFGVHE